MSGFIKSIKLREVADKFNNNEVFSVHDTRCNICNGELEIIEILNAEELLVYCNSCKLFHVISLTEKTITVYNLERDEKEINKIIEINSYISMSKTILTLITIGLDLYGAYSLFFKGRWVQALILVAFSIVTGIYNSTLQEKKLNNNALSLLDLCKKKDFTRKIFLDTFYDRDISFFKKKRNSNKSDENNTIEVTDKPSDKINSSSYYVLNDGRVVGNPHSEGSCSIPLSESCGVGYSIGHSYSSCNGISHSQSIGYSHGFSTGCSQPYYEDNN